MPFDFPTRQPKIFASPMRTLVAVENVTHRYGERVALEQVSFTVTSGQWVGLLGPNGSGKSTLFRLLSTLQPAQSGRILVDEQDLKLVPENIRPRLGVVFQHPALDKKLTVSENLRHHGHLYGWRGVRLRTRLEEMLLQMGLTERRDDLVEKLSGGLQRRVELAKALLPKPEILLLDEPSSGLDPAARRDFWQFLRTEQIASGLTILLTTHLMDEAEACDQLVVLDAGRVIADTTPAALKARVAGTLITVQGPDLVSLQAKIEEGFHLKPVRVGASLRLECGTGAADLLRRIAEAFPADISSLTLAQPSLEDAFIQITGHSFDSEAAR
jgi:ABC-2 type transport system ATP-binding protein